MKIRFAIGSLVAALIGMHSASAQVLPTTPAAAEQLEHANLLPLTQFYDLPKDLGAGKPGTLLKKEKFKQYALPPGVTAVRILYRSLSAKGNPVATSGVVLVPPGKAPQDGWPLIAWAHGTSGVARQCAPSAMKDVYYGADVLFPLLKAGFAIVATDYHGLGTDGAHEYVHKTANARDVIYSVAAAHEAVSNLSKRWVADGHSQGGLAAWGVAELQDAIRDPDFLGAVSVAGVAREADFFQHLNDTKGEGFYLAFMAFGIQARVPSFKPADLLTDAALTHYADVTSKGCWYYGYASYASQAPGSFMRPQAPKNPAVHEFFAENVLGEAPIAGSLLVIAGEADQTVPLSGVKDAVNHACKHGASIQFRSYPGLDHDPAMRDSLPDQIKWIRDRFNGVAATSSC